MPDSRQTSGSPLPAAAPANDRNRPSPTPEQQMAAIRQVQAQAEQRLKLGVQFFKAAEAHVSGHQDQLNEVRAAQQALREELQKDVTTSLRQYDSQLEKRDHELTERISVLEARLAKLEARWTHVNENVTTMAQRAEALLEQSRCMLTNRPRALGRAAQTAGMPASISASSLNAAPLPPASADAEATPRPEERKSAGAPGSLTEADRDAIYTKLIKRLHPPEAAA
ncbi:MAG: hypothetical protein IT443_09235 [Phycisphaeraceae bacterium]|nr:hypothetical protein [Phycisphaeraceae bacterium]